MSIAKKGNKGSGGRWEAEEEIDAEEEMMEHMEDQFEATLAAKGNNIWSAGGVRKDIAIRVLVNCFGSMVESMPQENAIPDNKGRYRSEDLVYTKLLDAARQVSKAKR
ncbi:hypothetical protein EON65_31515 [archaeon]|nr:MAG: hypothetical protein EON65_31515 [archaeon]